MVTAAGDGDSGCWESDMNKLEWCAVWCGVCSRKYSSGTDGKPTRFHCFSGKWVYDVRRVFAEDNDGDDDDNSDTTSTTPSMDDCIRIYWTWLAKWLQRTFFFSFLSHAICLVFGNFSSFFCCCSITEHGVLQTIFVWRKKGTQNIYVLCTSNAQYILFYQR